MLPKEMSRVRRAGDNHLGMLTLWTTKLLPSGVRCWIFGKNLQQTSGELRPLSVPSTVKILKRHMFCSIITFSCLNCKWLQLLFFLYRHRLGAQEMNSCSTLATSKGTLWNVVLNVYTCISVLLYPPPPPSSSPPPLSSSPSPSSLMKGRKGETDRNLPHADYFPQISQHLFRAMSNLGAQILMHFTMWVLRTQLFLP